MADQLENKAYEVVIRIFAAKLPFIAESYCRFEVNYDGNSVAHETSIVGPSTNPTWRVVEDHARYIHDWNRPHRDVTVTLWAKKDGQPHLIGRYRAPLNEARYTDSFFFAPTWVKLEGSPYCQPSPNDPDGNMIPQIEVEYFCRLSPVVGQCSYCETLMHHPSRNDEKEDSLDVLRKAPHTLPCLHTVCGEHLMQNGGLCPHVGCGNKVSSLNKYGNLVVDKYLQYKTQEGCRTCANCTVQRARIWCTNCQVFLCGTCDKNIHDKNLFFRAHTREDARKPYRITNSYKHICQEHNHPYTFWHRLLRKGYCDECHDLEDAKHHKTEEDEDDDEPVVVDYNEYRQKLTGTINGYLDMLKLNIKSIEAITDKCNEAVAAGALASEKNNDDIELQFEDLHNAVERRKMQLVQSLTTLADRQTNLLSKQRQLFANFVEHSNKSESMCRYVIGPVESEQAEQATALPLPDLFGLRNSIGELRTVKFTHKTYASGRITLKVSPEIHTVGFSIGAVSDTLENDTRNGSYLVKLNPQNEKYAQLGRAVMTGDLPYFFVIRTAAAGGLFPRLSAIGVTKYGANPDCSLVDPTQLPNVWAFSQSHTEDGFKWYFNHAKFSASLKWESHALRPRRLGLGEAIDSENKEEDLESLLNIRHPDSDFVGCLVNRQTCEMQLFKYTPHTDLRSDSRAFEVSQPMGFESFEHVYPSLSIMDGTYTEKDKGLIEIALSRFVRNFDQAIELWSELFA